MVTGLPRKKDLAGGTVGNLTDRDSGSGTVGSTVGYCRLYCRFKAASSGMVWNEERQIV